MTDVISDDDLADLLGDFYDCPVERAAVERVAPAAPAAPAAAATPARGKFYRRERVDLEAFRICVDNARAIFEAPAPRGCGGSFTIENGDGSRSTSSSFECFLEIIVQFYQSKLHNEHVIYDYAAGRTDGRLYGPYSLQNCQRKLRHAIGGGLYWDVDQVNSHPTIFAAICLRKQIAAPTLALYVADRASCIQRWTGVTYEMPKGKRTVKHTLETREDVKNFVIALLYGRASIATAISCDELRALAAEVAAAGATLWRDREFSAERKRATAKAAANWRTNKQGSFLFNICAIQEAAITQRAIALLEARGNEIATDCYDGFLVYKSDPDSGAPAPAVDVAALSADASAHFGYAIQFVEKPLDQAFDLTGLVALPDAESEAAITAATTDRRDGFDDLLPEGVAVIGDSPDRNANYTTNALGDDQVSDVALRSACGTGKTVYLVSVVRRLLERKPRARILFISCRVSLSSQLIADLRKVDPRFAYYKDIAGQLDLSKNPLSVWQVDSFDRIPDNLPAFDLVVIDEPAQLNAHIHTAGNGKSKSRFCTAVLAHVARAARVILTDNDLTSALVAAFASIRRGAGAATAQVVRSVFQPWAGTPVRLITGHYAKHAGISAVFTYADHQREERAAGRPWFSAVIACHSRKLADGLARAVLERYGENAPGAVKLYTSETGDAEKRADLEDANAVWGLDAQLRPVAIVYTGTVSVGVSCASAGVGHCFGFFTTGNAAAPQSSQMLFRCRALTGFTVAVYGPPGGRPPGSVAGICADLVLARNRHNIPDELRHDRAVGIRDLYGETATNAADLQRAITGSFEGRLFIADAVERNRSQAHFTARLVAILTGAGLVVAVESGAPPTLDAEKQLAKAVRQADSAASNDRATLIASGAGAAVDRREVREAEGKDGDEIGDRTRAEKLGDEGARLARVFGVAVEEVAGGVRDEQPYGGPDWVKYFGELADPYTRSKLYLSGRAAHRGPEATQFASIAEAAGFRDRAAALLGVDLRTEEPVRFAPSTCDPLVSNGAKPFADEVNTHGRRVFGATNGPNRARRECKRAAVVAALREVLGWFGGSVTAEYKTASDRDKGKVAAYLITWDWRASPERPLLGPAPAPLVIAPRVNE